MYVYADNAATTKMSPTAVKAMTAYFETVYANPSSLHSAGQEAKEALENARARLANILGCEPREIYFTSGGSEADNQAIVSAARIGARNHFSLSCIGEGNGNSLQCSCLENPRDGGAWWAA